MQKMFNGGCEKNYMITSVIVTKEKKINEVGEFDLTRALNGFALRWKKSEVSRVNR